MKTIFEVDDLRRLRTCVQKSLVELGILVPKLTKNSSSRKSKRLQSKVKDKNQTAPSIFGLPLSDIPSDFIDGCGYVPRFLVDAVNFIDVNIDTIGLFRKTGSVHRQKELKRIIENGGSVKCAKLVDDVANLVKQFLRELPEALITSTLEGHFMKALEIDEESTKLRAILYLCLLLPLDHLGTLRYFTLLLSRIVTHSGENRMDCTNLALVITPNILGGCSDKSLHGNERHLSVQTALVEVLIRSAALIGTVTPELEELMIVEVEPSFEGSDGEASFDKSQRKKRRSGSLQGMMSSIEQNLRSWRSSKKTSVETSYSNQSSISSTSSQAEVQSLPETKTPVLRKRKAEDDPHGLSKKKVRTIMKGLPQQSLLGGQSFDLTSMSVSFKGNSTFPTSLSMTESRDPKEDSTFVFSSASFQETKKRFPSPFRNKRLSPKICHSGKKKNKLLRMLSVNHDHSKAKHLRDSASSRKHHKTHSSPGRVLDDQSKLTKEPLNTADDGSMENVYIIDDKSDISSLAENLEFDLYDQVSMTSPDVSLESCGSKMHSRSSVRSQAEQGTPTKSLLRRGRPNTPTNGLRPSLKMKYCHDEDPIVDVDAKTIDELSSHVEVIVCNALVDGTNTWASASTCSEDENAAVN